MDKDRDGERGNWGIRSIMPWKINYVQRTGFYISADILRRDTWENANALSNMYTNYGCEHSMTFDECSAFNIVSIVAAFYWNSFRYPLFIITSQITVIKQKLLNY